MKLENIYMGLTAVLCVVFILTAAFLLVNMIYLVIVQLLSLGWVALSLAAIGIVAAVAIVYVLNFIGAKLNAYFN